MPALKNPNHELFAQARAQGMSQNDAYEAAGYEPNEGNAGRLNRNEQVEQRVQEILGLAAERTLATVEALTARLNALAHRAEQLDDPPSMQVARAALMDIAKLNGLIVEKRENTNTVIRAEDVSDDELAAIIARGRGIRRRRDSGETPLN